MRKFWLKNARGDLWDLTPTDPTYHRGSFLNAPTGLGIQTRIRSFELENVIFVEDIETTQQVIRGELFFKDYKHFDRFVAFIGTTRETLKLYYSPDGVSLHNKLNKQWYKEILIQELGKTEIDRRTGFLRCGVRFASMSRWRRDVSIVLELSRHGDPLVYPFFYPYFYGGSNNLAVEIDNTGNLPTSCIITIEATSDSPHIRLTQNGEIVSQARYNLIVRPGSHLIIDSRADRQEATMITILGNQTARENVYFTGEKDYAYQNFITIPTGKSMLLVSAQNANFGRVTVEYSIQRELI